MNRNILKLAILAFTLLTFNVYAETYDVDYDADYAVPTIPNVLKSGDVINLKFGDEYIDAGFFDESGNYTDFSFVNGYDGCEIHNYDKNKNKITTNTVDTSYCPSKFVDGDPLKYGPIVIPTINGKAYYFKNSFTSTDYTYFYMDIVGKVETTNIACKSEELSYGDSTNCILYATLYNPTASISFNLSSSKYLLSNIKNDSFWSSMNLTDNSGSKSVTLTNDSYKTSNASLSAPADVKLVGFDIKSVTNENEKIKIEASNIESQIYYNNAVIPSSASDATLIVNNLLVDEPTTTTTTTTQSTTTEEVKNPETGVSRYTYLLLPIALLIASVLLFYRKSLFKKL